MNAKAIIAQLDAELEVVRADRTRLLQIIKELSTQLSLRKDELAEIEQRHEASE
jgi:hypothetical protein